jgi:DNA repair exonuclease SbcCD nuclease subunit
MRALVIGDPHIKTSNIQDSEKILNSALFFGKNNKVPVMIILGDIFDTHNVVDLKVAIFLKSWMKRASEFFEHIVIINGNHDSSSNKREDPSCNSNILAFGDFKKVEVVYNTYSIENVDFIGYQHSEEEFFEKCKGLKGNILISHQTFKSAKYENGFYAPDGFDYDKVKHEYIISGHIHSKQAFGKVFYPGSPSWQKASDAGEEKFLYIIDFTDTGYKIEKTLDCGTILKPYKKFHFKEKDEAFPDLEENSFNYLTLEGSSEWISKVLPKYKSLAKIKLIYKDIKRRQDYNKKYSFGDFLEKKLKNESKDIRDMILKEVGENFVC